MSKQFDRARVHINQMENEWNQLKEANKGLRERADKAEMARNEWHDKYVELKLSRENPETVHLAPQLTAQDLDDSPVGSTLMSKLAGETSPLVKHEDGEWAYADDLADPFPSFTSGELFEYPDDDWAHATLMRPYTPGREAV